MSQDEMICRSVTHLPLLFAAATFMETAGVTEFFWLRRSFLFLSLYRFSCPLFLGYYWKTGVLF
jgi:hypothetical protein